MNDLPDIFLLYRLFTCTARPGKSAVVTPLYELHRSMCLHRSGSLQLRSQISPSRMTTSARDRLEPHSAVSIKFENTQLLNHLPSFHGHKRQAVTQMKG
jgi:hypothetical protein